jgi:hypothetical protein
MLLLMRNFVVLVLILTIINVPIMLMYSGSDDIWAFKNLETAVSDANYVECVTTSSSASFIPMQCKKEYVIGPIL